MDPNGVEELEREFSSLVARVNSQGPDVDLASVQTQLNHITGQLVALKSLPEQTAAIDRRIANLESDVRALSRKVTDHETKSKERGDSSLLIGLLGLLLAIVSLAVGLPALLGGGGSQDVTINPESSAPITSEVAEEALPATTTLAPNEACPRAASTQTIEVPPGSVIVGEWLGDGIRVLRCATPEGLLIYYGQTRAGDILLPARIEAGDFVAANSDTVYRLNGSAGLLEVSQSGEILASFQVERDR